MNEDTLKNLIVVKRSGQRVSFNSLKIVIAIKNAFDSVDANYSNKDVNTVFSDTIKFILDNYKGRKTINVEDIQDIIEKTLQEDNYSNVFEAFSSYRIRRSESRKNFQEKQQHKFARAIEKINFINPMNIKTKDVLFEYGDIISYEYTKAYVLDSKYTRASKEGKMYIHNMKYFYYGYMGNTFLDMQNVLSYGDFYDVIDMIINSSKEVKGELGICSFDKILNNHVKNKYREMFIKLLNKYLSNMGFDYLVNSKKVEDKIKKECDFSINHSDYDEIFNNDMLLMILNKANKDAKDFVEDYYRYNIKKILLILNQNGISCNISIGNSEDVFDTFIREITVDIVLNIDYLDNVCIIYKVSNNIKEAIKLVVARKNVILNFNGNRDVEYFSDGSRIYENIYSDSVSCGRMIVSNTSINMARIGIKYKKLDSNFYHELDSLIDLVKNELIMVFESIGDKTKDNYDYLFNKNIYDSDKLEPRQKIRKVIKNGTLNINLSGLLECAKIINKENYLEVALKIVKYINKKVFLMSLDNRLNFTISHIVNESAMDFMDIDSSIFGNIFNKDYYGNLGSISNLNDVNMINKINKLFTGGFVLDLCVNNKIFDKEIAKIVEKLSAEYTGLVAIRRKL